jgi:hypothetical protein
MWKLWQFDIESRRHHWNTGTCKMRNEIETKRNKSKRNSPNLNVIYQSETKSKRNSPNLNVIYQSETKSKRNEINPFRFGKFRFVSMNFVSIYFVSFRFVSISFCILQVPETNTVITKFIVFSYHFMSFWNS